MIVVDLYDDIFMKYANKYDVPFTWVKGVAGAESDWNPKAYRAEPQIDDASRGLMQVLYRTAYALGYRGDPEGLYDPETNVNFGTKLLHDLIVRFGRDFNAVYSAYNSGSPTKYQTSSQVRQNLDRAIRYVQAVEQDPRIVLVEPSDRVLPPPPSTTTETGLADASLITIGLIAGVMLYFFTK